MDGTDGDERYLSSYAASQPYGLTRPGGLVGHNYLDEDDDVEEYNYKRSEGFNPLWHPKKRKLKSLSSSFELVPHVLVPTPPVTKSGGRNTLTDWSEHETSVLLDAWGQRFVRRGRKSLRLEEWQEVAVKVSRGSKLERTDTQCRNRLDTLKKKYKKEKALLENNKVSNTKWVYFKKMNMLMCGVDLYLHCTNSQDGDDDLLTPKKSKSVGEKVNGGSFKLLADSINKFGEIYEKIENGKRKQMVEIEKMRMDFYKDLELQKMKILDRTRAEIAKIRQGGYGENDDDDDYEDNIRV